MHVAGAMTIAFCGFLILMWKGTCWYRRQLLQPIADQFEELTKFRTSLAGGGISGKFQGRAVSVSVIFKRYSRDMCIETPCNGTVPFKIETPHFKSYLVGDFLPNFSGDFTSFSERPERFRGLINRGDVNSLMRSLLEAYRADSITNGYSLIVIFKRFRKELLDAGSIRTVLSDIISLARILDEDAKQAKLAEGIDWL